MIDDYASTTRDRNGTRVGPQSMKSIDIPIRLGYFRQVRERQRKGICVQRKLTPIEGYGQPSTNTFQQRFLGGPVLVENLLPALRILLRGQRFNLHEPEIPSGDGLGSDTLPFAFDIHPYGSFPGESTQGLIFGVTKIKLQRALPHAVYQGGLSLGSIGEFDGTAPFSDVQAQYLPQNGPTIGKAGLMYWTDKAVGTSTLGFIQRLKQNFHPGPFLIEAEVEHMHFIVTEYGYQRSVVWG